MLNRELKTLNEEKIIQEANEVIQKQIKIAKIIK